MRNPFKSIREIRSKTGVLHFKRWALIESRWFNIYIHYIARSDEDKHLHEHPWSFISIPLAGGYIHRIGRLDGIGHYCENKEKCLPFRPMFMRWRDCHKVKLIHPTWSLVFTGPRVNDNWCYKVNENWIGNQTYRIRKNAGTL